MKTTFELNDIDQIVEEKGHAKESVIPILQAIQNLYKYLPDEALERVCEITDILKLSQSTVSGHLRILKEAGIVDDTKNGLWVEYHLCRDRQMNQQLLDLAQTIFETDKEMQTERKRASRADRQILCKK